MSEDDKSYEPFQPDAVAPARGGCGKAALFGCGGLLLLLLVAVVVFLFKVREITAWGFGVMEKQVMARLPAETSDEDVQRIRAGFAGVIEAVQNDTVDPRALNQLQPVILRFSDPNKRPQQEDVDRLIELLEAAAGIEPMPSDEPRGSPLPEPAQ